MTTKQASSMQRLRQRRLKRTLLTGLGALFCLLAAYIGYAFAHSPFFSLVEIRIEGNATVSRDEVIALSGLRIGENLMGISGRGVADSVLLHPYIKDVAVSRSFPNRVEIRISERTPMATIDGDGRYLILDESGRCLTEASVAGADIRALPSIRCSDEAMSLSPGEQTEDKGVLAALELIKRLDPFFIQSILAFDAPSAERLAVINLDGLPVYFGPPEDLDRKLQNYEDILIKNAINCNAETLHYVDLRYDTQITLNWK